MALPIGCLALTLGLGEQRKSLKKNAKLKQKVVEEVNDHKSLLHSEQMP